MVILIVQLQPALGQTLHGSCPLLLVQVELCQVQVLL
jgi:hypothetical protein